MSVNRLNQHFGSQSAGARPQREPAAEAGFEAVPLAGMPDGGRIEESRSLYDFAYFLAQVCGGNDAGAVRRWLAE